MTQAPRSSSSNLTRSTLGTGRLSVLALLGSFAGAVPLPFVPPQLLSRIRGAVVYDVVARRGLSLTQEARRELAHAPFSTSGGAVLRTVTFFARRSLRRLGALGLLPPLTAWVEIYALGLLLERYLDTGRPSNSVRIDREEARALRRAIDQAVRGALSLQALEAPSEGMPDPTDDWRDLPTRITDGVLLAVAAVPSFARKRLESAFDAAIAEASQVGNKETHGG